MRPTKLLKQYEDLLCRAYEKGNRISGASYKVKETLVHFGYAKCVGVTEAGYDDYVLTEEGIKKAAELMATKKLAVVESPEIENLPDEIKTKLSILDDIIEMLSNQNSTTKIIKLNGIRARFDRSGPTKIIIQLSKSPEDKSKM